MIMKPNQEKSFRIKNYETPQMRVCKLTTERVCFTSSSYTENPFINDGNDRNTIDPYSIWK